jgi:putative membrane protein
MKDLHRSHVHVVALFASLLMIAVASCGQKQEQTAQTPESTAPPPAAVPALTDANIAAIVVTANTADIRNGEMAKTNSKNKAVVAFAQQMITDHTSVNKQATDLVTKLNVTPEENDTSRQLASSSDATRESLRAKTGADFDKAYIDNEVAYHQAVLDMLDNTLIPGAQNAELKSLLESVRPAFVAHLDHAKKVQGSLGT